MNEIVKKGDTLDDILEPLTRSQRLNITLRLCGYSIVDAREKSQVKQHTIERWLDDPNYRSLVEHVLENKKLYQPDALSLWARDLSVDGKRLIHNLIGKIDKWDDLDKLDKMYVWKAIELVNKLAPQSSGGDGSYDEVILKRHRAIGE